MCLTKLNDEDKKGVAFLDVADEIKRRNAEQPEYKLTFQFKGFNLNDDFAFFTFTTLEVLEWIYVLMMKMKLKLKYIDYDFFLNDRVVDRLDHQYKPREDSANASTTTASELRKKPQRQERDCGAEEEHGPAQRPADEPDADAAGGGEGQEGAAARGEEAGAAGAGDQRGVVRGGAQGVPRRREQTTKVPRVLTYHDDESGRDYDIGLEAIIGGSWTELTNDNTPLDIVVVKPPHADTKITNEDEVRGKVALVYRGKCSFVNKAHHVQNAGAIAMICVNSDNTNLTITNNGNPTLADTITIPVTCISCNIGDNIKSELTSGTCNTVRVKSK